MIREMNQCKIEISFVVKDSLIEVNLYDREDKCLPYEITLKVPYQRHFLEVTKQDQKLLKDDLVY